MLEARFGIIQGLLQGTTANNIVCTCPCCQNTFRFQQSLKKEEEKKRKNPIEKGKI